MTSIVIIGSGRLGQACAQAIASMGNVSVLTSSDIDIGNPESVDRVLERADWVINTAAYTDVDGCETHTQKAHRVNADGARHVARRCATIQARLVHISTDYVFDGAGTTPYGETDPVAPVSVYGQTKYLGEQAVVAECPDAYVFRVQWLYGAGGTDFVDAMHRLAQTQAEIRVVSDQWGSPTWTGSVAQALRAVIEHGAVPPGLYHMPSTGYTNWYAYACAILQNMPNAPVVIPVPTTAYPRSAQRPLNGRLNGEKLANYIDPLPDWNAALSAYLEAL